MAAAAAAAAAAALRRLGSRVKVRTGVCVTEDSCRKSAYFEQLKELLSSGWGRIDERTRGIILKTCTSSAVVTVWGAGVLSVTNALERLGLIETGLTNTVHLKEHIAAVVKAENEKSIQQLKYQHEEDRAQLKKLSKEFEAHRTLTKMWISHMIKKTLDPLSPQDISKIQGAFALFDKAGAGFVTQEEASFVLEIFGEKISEADMNKLMAQSGKIFLADFLEFIANKHAKTTEVQRSELKVKKVTQEEDVTAEGS